MEELRLSRGRVGGSAAHSGIAFQDKVAGLLAAHVLAGTPVDFFGLPANITPTSIALETAAPVDDILVTTSAGGFCFINVKTSVTRSKNPASPLGSVLDQFVRLWIACESGKSNRSWQRPLEPDRDRLVLVTGRRRSAAFVDPFSKVLSRIVDRGSIVPAETIVSAASEQGVYDEVLRLLQLAVRRHTGEEAAEAVIASLLRLVRIAVLDPDGRDRGNILALLKTAVLHDPTDAERTWVELVSECQRLAENQSGGDLASLRSFLTSRGIRLLPDQHIAGDVRRLEQFTQETLSSLSHLAHLDVPTATGPGRIEIDRTVTDALVAHAPEKSFLLIGEPGSGKSGAVHSAAERLISQGHPVVVIAVDRHPVPTMDDLTRNLRLESASLIDLLRRWTSDKQGVLFIDALDATRGGPSDGVFQELIRRVIHEAPNWQIVASIRAFDLRFGVTYRSLFAGHPVNDTYRDPEFSKVKHLLVRPLTEEELNQVWAKSPLMAITYRQGTEALRSLLKSPFNLFLLADVLSAGTRNLGNVTTQVELLHLYWSYRVMGTDHRGLARQAVLKRAVDQMLEQRRLQVPVNDLAGVQTEDLDRLLSEGVLVPVEGIQDRFKGISFAHHVLFDYAVARLTLGGGRTPDFAARLTSSDERALLIAPGAIMALQILWQEDGVRRPVFWSKALAVGGAIKKGAFFRMLPARVAAELTREVEDFEPVLDCLRRSDCPDKAAAVFLVQHCIGALAAGVPCQSTTTSPRGPWPAIVRALAEASVSDIGRVLKPLIGHWTDISADLSSGEKADINVAARLMLQSGMGEPYDTGMVHLGIRAVARTVESAPAESIEALKQLLAPNRVLSHGHEELFSFAQELEHLLTQVPVSSRLIADIYRAAYCTRLPSVEETTRLHRSLILNLTSNKRQDFEIVRYRLYETFPAFFDADPATAADALIDIANCRMNEEGQGAEEIVAISVGGLQIQYQADRGYVWIDRHDDHRSPPIRSFETGMIALVDAGRVESLDRVIDLVIRRNRLASIWASLIRAGAARPEVLGRRVMQLLTAPPVLEGLYTRKSAGDLIAALFPLLSEPDRLVIEKAVMDTREYSQSLLLAYMDEHLIVSDKTRQRRLALESEGLLSRDRESFEISGGPAALEDNWWLKAKGVDLSVEANARLTDVIHVVEELRRPAGDETQKGKAIAERWDEIESLYATLQSRRDIPEALLMAGWDAAAEVARIAAEVSKNSSDLARFPGIEEIILGALDPALWPAAIPDPQGEAAFARTQSWSSPAPRVDAAGALMALARARGYPDDRLGELIEALARDPSPVVRHQILCRTNMLFHANPPLMWKLCEIGFSEEANEGVLSFFLPAIGRVLDSRPEWFTERLLALDSRTGEKHEERHQFLSHIVQLVLRLWLLHDQGRAEECIRAWTDNPIGHPERIQNALSALRGALLQGDPVRRDPRDDLIRRRTIEIFERVVLKLGPILSELAQRKDLGEPERAIAQTTIAILDRAVTEIYFGSGAHGMSGRRDTEVENPVAVTPEVRARFLREMAPALKGLTPVPYPSVTHRLLETLEVFISDDPETVFRLVTDALVGGGRMGGYQVESLGAELFVRIIRRYLADFRSMLALDDDLRQRLMRALDVFVEAGWPEARQLVYELPEMLR